MSRVDEVLEFWFGTGEEYGEFRKQWFEKDAEFDREVRERFLADYERAAAGELDAWSESVRGTLALVIVLDQFPRNMFRGEGRTHATDERAVTFARRAIDRGQDRELDVIQRWFLYIPFMHSESLADQDRSVELFAALGRERPDLTENVAYAEHHREIVARFGRFPHRNELLGRQSTAEEEEFLREPGSSF